MARRKASAAPATSWGVSPLILSPMSNAAAWAGANRPSISASKAAPASSRSRESRWDSFCTADRRAESSVTGVTCGAGLG